MEYSQYSMDRERERGRQDEVFKRGGLDIHLAHKTTDE
jgi:hypothetical protein